MICLHRRYAFGDPKANPIIPAESATGWADHDDALDRAGCVWLPIFMYDHGSQHLFTGPALRSTCQHWQWDGGRVGYTYVTREQIRQNFGVQRVTKKTIAKVLGILNSEVEVYNQFINGDVYGFSIDDAMGNPVDSSWGYYGWDYAKQQAKDAFELYLLEHKIISEPAK